MLCSFVRFGLGFGGLASVVVMYHNCPNNVPLILRGSLGQRTFRGILPRSSDLPRPRLEHKQRVTASMGGAGVRAFASATWPTARLGKASDARGKYDALTLVTADLRRCSVRWLLRRTLSRRRGSRAD